MNLKNFLISRQQIIVLVIGYLLVAGLAFSLGKISASKHQAPEIRIEQAFTPLNNTAETAPEQLESGNNSSNPGSVAGANCQAGQIKGNISGTSKVYHMPGGSFYNRTTPEQCFNTEAEAVTAGFRKSKN
jgi:hypothetical protein